MLVRHINVPVPLGLPHLHLKLLVGVIGVLFAASGHVAVEVAVGERRLLLPAVGGLGWGRSSCLVSCLFATGGRASGGGLVADLLVGGGLGDNVLEELEVLVVGDGGCLGERG